MMIGPEPMIRMRWMSLRRGISASLVLLHQLHEIVEQIVGIVRAGRGLRVVLHAEHRVVAMAEPFQRLVVQIDVREFDLARRSASPGSTAKPWLCDVISTLLVTLLSTG